VRNIGLMQGILGGAIIGALGGLTLALISKVA
jgi:hypothetical protein